MVMSIKKLILLLVTLSILNYIFKPEVIKNISKPDNIIKIKCQIDSKQYSVGTGFYIDHNHIMTAYHVVSNNCLDAHRDVPLKVNTYRLMTMLLYYQLHIILMIISCYPVKI